MTPIEKFIRDNYNPTVTETKLGVCCLFKHKGGLTEDSIVYFERPKKAWSKKPIISNEQFIITDADTKDLLDFLSMYFNLDESNYMEVKGVILDMATKSITKHYGEEN